MMYFYLILFFKLIIPNVIIIS